MIHNIYLQSPNKKKKITELTNFFHSYVNIMLHNVHNFNYVCARMYVCMRLCLNTCTHI